MIERVSADRGSVFVTVGTDHHPFDRLVEWVDVWQRAHPDARCFVQFGTSTHPRTAEGAAYLSHDETGERIAAARAIVCHGGPGTIIDCLRSGRMPIVVPRRQREGEHVDDHQVRFTSRLEQAGYVRIARSCEELATLIDADLDAPSIARSLVTDGALMDSVERFAALVAPWLSSA